MIARAMKRTLLAIGLAVLVSMMLAPRGKSGHSYMPFFIHGWPGYFSEYTTKEYRRRVASALDGGLPPCSPEKTSFNWDPGCLEKDEVIPANPANPYADIIPRHVQYAESVVHPAHWEWTSVKPVAIDRLALQTVFLATFFAVLANIRWRRMRLR
jgi:hypothetical protein